MLRWLKLFGMRMRTIAVIEREYGRRLEVAGGPDTALFNATTRRFRDMGGNEYDAAAAFIGADTVLDYQRGGPGKVRLVDVLTVTIRLMPSMARPDIARHNLEKIQEAAEAAL